MARRRTACRDRLGCVTPKFAEPNNGVLFAGVEPKGRALRVRPLHDHHRLLLRLPQGVGHLPHDRRDLFGRGGVAHAVAWAVRLGHLMGSRLCQEESLTNPMAGRRSTTWRSLRPFAPYPSGTSPPAPRIASPAPRPSPGAAGSLVDTVGRAREDNEAASPRDQSERRWCQTGSV